MEEQSENYDESSLGISFTKTGTESGGREDEAEEFETLEVSEVSDETPSLEEESDGEERGVRVVESGEVVVRSEVEGDLEGVGENTMVDVFVQLFTVDFSFKIKSPKNTFYAR